jgi:hypothetical protein
VDVGSVAVAGGIAGHKEKTDWDLAKNHRILLLPVCLKNRANCEYSLEVSDICGYNLHNFEIAKMTCNTDITILENLEHKKHIETTTLAIKGPL